MTDILSPTEGQSGTLELTVAQEATIFFDPAPFTLPSPPTEFRVYIEANESILQNISLSSIELFSRVGNYGSTTPSSLEDIGDAGSDGNPDKAAVFLGSSIRYILFDSQVTEKKETLYLVSATTDGEPFIGKNVIILKK